LKTGKLSAKNGQNLIFFWTPYDGKNGRKGLQHTFLQKPNTFCFMDSAVKLSAELRSVPVLWQIIRKKCSKSDFLGYPLTVKTTSAYIPGRTKHILFYDFCSKTLRRA
jgi:hypothetical protein